MTFPDWARAHGPPLFEANIRTHPTDFCVTEICDIEFSGDGEHDYLWVEKTGANTHWVAARLAEHAGVPTRDVGYAGLKDRHAVTRQWFSVRRVAEIDWAQLAAEGVAVLGQRRHQRKLRRGAHRGNSFTVGLRADDTAQFLPAIESRLEKIAQDGVPNYFGEQRFGRDGQNIALCRSLFGGQHMARNKRSIALSAARAVIFNFVLDRRVREQTWARILPGELANLEGSASVFAVARPDADVERRCREGDIHPSGPLWGDDSPQTSGQVADLEAAAAFTHRELTSGLVAAGVQPGRRALRLPVRDLRWDFEKDVLWLNFRLGKGGYATGVLRELAAATAPGN